MLSRCLRVLCLIAVIVPGGLAATAGCTPAKSLEPDADHDGVPDSVDRCPGKKEDGLDPDPRDGCPKE